MTTERNPRVSQAIMPNVVAHPTTGRSALAQGISDVAGLASEARQQHLADEVSGRLLQTQEEFLADESNFLVDDDPLMNLDIEGRSAVQSFVEIQAKLTAAAEQGSAPVTELKIRQERVLREYMQRYPRLVGLFQQAATGVLGYNPIGSEINSLAQKNQMRRSEVQKIYDRVTSAADSAGVNPALQLTDPDQYWSQALDALSKAERLAMLDRNLKAMQAVGGTYAIEARQFIRQNQGAISQGVVRDVISPLLQEVATMPLEHRTSEAGKGALDAVRAQLVVSRSEFVGEFYNEYFTNSDMTMAELEAELKPILDVYDYAIANTSDEQILAKLNHLVKAQESEFFLAFPEAQRLKLMADVLNNHEVAAAIQMNRRVGSHIARIMENILNATYGGRPMPGAHRTPPASDPTGRVNPAAADGSLPGPEDFGSPEEAVAAYDLHHAYMRSAARAGREADNPTDRNVAYAAAAAQATQFANTYLDELKNNGRMMPRDVVDQYISFLADPNTLPIFRADVQDPLPGIDRQRLAEGLGVMLRQESMSIARDMRRIVLSTFEEMHRGSSGDVTTLFGLVTPSWDASSNRPRYILDEDAWEALEDRGFTPWVGDRRLQKVRMKRALDRLNDSPEMAFLGQLTMASAHLIGSQRYAQAMDEEVMRILGINPESLAGN